MELGDQLVGLVQELQEKGHIQMTAERPFA